MYSRRGYLKAFQIEMQYRGEPLNCWASHREAAKAIPGSTKSCHCIHFVGNEVQVPPLAEADQSFQDAGGVNLATRIMRVAE